MTPWTEAVCPGGLGVLSPLPRLLATGRIFWGLQQNARLGGGFSSLWCHWAPLFLRECRDVSLRLGAQDHENDCLLGVFWCQALRSVLSRTSSHLILKMYWPGVEQGLRDGVLREAGGQTGEPHGWAPGASKGTGAFKKGSPLRAGRDLG